MKKILFGSLFVLFFIVLTGCNATSAGEEDKEFIIGATAGPYSDQLQEGIIPILEEDGYQVEVVEFNDYIQPNNALDAGELDANLYQHRVFLETFNEDHGMDLVSLFAVPTAPIGIYSERHTSIDDVEEGMKVTLPNDPVNLARSLIMLEEHGWITISEDVSPSTASEKDIEENIHGLQFEPIDPAQTPRSLSDTDFAFVNGNFAIASGMELESAVAIEETTEDYLNYFVVRSEDADSEFAESVRAAYETEEFLEYTNEFLKGYAKPPYLVELEESLN